mmetsp:Transcript_35678/g.87409  ORF Transcript_35678/g.87409 Transcript_35678/m.87409 type:complete len:250 (+) Transcript_35678:1-750(+)
MHRMVLSVNSDRRVACISASVSGSIALVASSSNRILVCRSSARARQICWRWPWEKFSPRSATSALSPLGRDRTWLPRWERSRALQTAISSCCCNGSTLNRKVPEKRTASWGTKEIRERRSPRPILQTFTPSMKISPSVGSTMRSSASSREDFPLPVRPQMPTRWRSEMFRFSPRMMNGRLSRYRKDMPRIWIAPCCGQDGEGLRSKVVSCSASRGSRVYSSTRSTATMLVSRSEAMRTIQFMAWVTLRP